MSDPRRSAGLVGTEREQPVDYRTGLDEVVARFVARATAAAAEVKPRKRWVLLTLFAEAHKRAAAEIQALAEKEAGHG
jgi:hypothetical protein